MPLNIVARQRHRLSWHLYSPTHRLCRWRIRDRRFTIISNNCWGAALYSEMGLAYATPFVGLFILPECYLAMLNDLRGHLKMPLRFVSRTKYEFVAANRERKSDRYPIALLGDAELHFLHYASEQEAKAKWERRLDRVHWDRLFVKFCDYQRPTVEQFHAFDGLDFEHKVCFAGNAVDGLQTAIHVPDVTGDGHVSNGLVLYRMCKAVFDIPDWLKAIQRWLSCGWAKELYSGDSGADPVDRLPVVSCDCAVDKKMNSVA